MSLYGEWKSAQLLGREAEWASTLVDCMSVDHIARSVVELTKDDEIMQLISATHALDPQEDA